MPLGAVILVVAIPVAGIQVGVMQVEVIQVAVTQVEANLVGAIQAAVNSAAFRMDKGKSSPLSVVRLCMK